MSKYLLTGGTGVLGSQLIESNPERYWAPSSSELNITHINNIYDFKTRHYHKLVGLDGIIHCAAFTNVSGAEINRIQAIETNTIGTRNIVYNLCQSLNLKMIYISTDYVYEGLCGNYKETDPTRPINFYSITKLLGEAYVSPEDLIIRTSFKPNTKWKFAKAFIDLYSSTDYVDIIAPKIEWLIEQNVGGVYNVGSERKSVYELAKLRAPEIAPMSILDVKGVRLPTDISMSLNKYNELYSNICKK